jgi:hypothetical protein
LPKHREGQLPFFFRRAKLVAHLYWQKEPGTDVILKYSNRHGRGISWVRNRAVDAFARFQNSPKKILWLERQQARAVENENYFNEYIDFLEKEKPDLVFCSHQRSELAVPAILAARKLGIPTATFIYSWDNLSKGRMAVHPNYFMVWSEHMRDEMRRFYPDVEEECIFVVGTPQFEHYFNHSIIEARHVFLQRHGLNPARPVICFSGDDITTSPHDPDYLEDLAQSLQEFSSETRPQILFRRTPTDVSGRYDAVLKRFPEIVSIEPAWVNLSNNDWSKVIPTDEDVKLLVNTVNHCDVVVNVGSTMALDFAINHKPAIYLAYNPTSWKPGERWSIEDVYRHPHFNHMGQFNPVYWARSKQELPVLLQECIGNPGKMELQRAAWVNFLVEPPLDHASQRCVDALLHLVENDGCRTES